MKLELKHWLAYSGKNTLVYGGSELSTLISAVPYGDEIELYLDHPTLGRITGSSLEHSLVLRPWGDLTKEIEVNGEKFVPGEYLSELIDEHSMGYNDHYFDYYNNKYEIENVLCQPFFIVDNLLEFGFNVFNLPENLYIDINTINK